MTAHEAALRARLVLPLAPSNKSLAQTNKSQDGAKATKRYRPEGDVGEAKETAHFSHRRRVKRPSLNLLCQLILCVFVVPLFKASQPEVADVADFPDANQLLLLGPIECRKEPLAPEPSFLLRGAFRRRAGIKGGVWPRYPGVAPLSVSSGVIVA
jgi:hypothetical protein